MPNCSERVGERKRRRGGLLALVAVIGCFSLAAPAAQAASVEGGNAFNELSSKAQQEETTTATTTTATTTSSESEPHNGNKTIFIGIGAAAVLLVVIAFVIVRDARRVAPAGAETAIEGRAGRDNAARQRKRREKARAARAQRKKNR